MTGCIEEPEWFGNRHPADVAERMSAVQARQDTLEAAARGLARTADILATARRERDEAWERQAALEAALHEVVATFYERGNPGYAAVRSCWVPVARLQEWVRLLRP